jgi:putative transposase
LQFAPSLSHRLSRGTFYFAQTGTSHFAATGFAEGVACGVRLRYDHGSQLMNDGLQNEIAFFCIESSPAFVRKSKGSGCIERFFRTLKEQLLWVSDFTTLEELAEALEEFRQRYNNHWLLERLSFQSPRQARQRLLALAAAA